MSLTEKKKLFNEEANHTAKGILTGQDAGIREWNRAIYPWTYRLWKVMLKNFWHSDEVPLGDDKTKFKDLTEAEMRAFRKTISFLNFLDSLQSENLPNIADYVQAWEIRSLLNLQTFQEENHAESYSKVLLSVCEPELIEEIFDEWRNDPLLKERNIMIADLYQNFIDNPNHENFVRACMANYCLESLYFYSAFTFFYLLARNGKMLQTAQMVRFIQKDELTHVVMFQNMIKELQKEHPDIFSHEFIEELRMMVKTAVEWEVKWGKTIFNNEIDGITDEVLERYIKWLSNDRLKRLGFEPLYPEIVENPIKWVEKFEDPNNTKEDFFEVASVTNYQLPDEEMGWGDL